MQKYLSIFLLQLFLSYSFVAAQENEDCTEAVPIQTFHPLFDDSSVPRIDIEIAPMDLQAIFAFPESDTEYPTIFTYKSGEEETVMENVGFRLRGNTSRNAAKKSFKISFNSFDTGRKFQGLEKMNLNGEHNDPSIIRAKLAWDLLGQMDVIGAKANHVELYINGEYYGLYLNVEHIDEEFLKDRYGENDDGNLYKCLYPANLNFEGSSPEVYKEEEFGRRKYDLKTNNEADDYSDLAHFITILNETSTADFKVEISKVFDVDVFLRTLATDVFTANWDGYSFNVNNFYLYHNPATDKFEYIAYDLDNTFGIDWFNVNWAERNVYDWTSDFHDNVLTNRILEVPEFRNRYSYYLQKLVNVYAHPDTYFPILDCLKEKITPFAEADTYRTLDYGFSVADFHDSYDEFAKGHVKYGIKDYIVTRRNSILNQLQTPNIPPIIRRVQHYPSIPPTNTPITFLATIEDDNDDFPTVILNYQLQGGDWMYATMKDDGNSNDGTANDGVYGYVLQSSDITANSTIQYYIAATDALVANNREPLVGHFSVSVVGERVALRINEFMASNSETVADEFGEFDDWIEIFNAGNAPIFLGDKYLTDNLNNPDKWQLPDMVLQPQEFVLIWADNSPEQGTFHADFKLSKEEESIGIFDSEEQNFAFIDGLSYQNAENDVAYGLTIDGEGVYKRLSVPTPNKSNILVGIGEQIEALRHFIKGGNVYPNPFTEKFEVLLDLKQNVHIGVTLINTLGQKIEVTPLQFFKAGKVKFSCMLDDDFPNDLYILELRVKTEDKIPFQIPLKRVLKW